MLSRICHAKIDNFSDDHILCSLITIKAEVPENEGDVNKCDEEGESGDVEVPMPVCQHHGQNQCLRQSLNSQDKDSQIELFSIPFVKKYN